eukprot:916407-Rhodomonas_salina.1
MRCRTLTEAILRTGPDRMKELEDELEFAKEKWEAEEQNHQKSCVLLTAAEEREKKLAEEVRALKEELSLASGGGGGGPADARTQKLVNEKRKLAIEVQTLKEGKEAAEQRAKALAAANERLKKGASPTALTPSVRLRPPEDGFGFAIQDLTFGTGGFGFENPSLGFRVSGFGFRALAWRLH